MKKALKWLAIIVATPILLFLIFALLLYCPPVQNWVVKRVANSIAEKTGMKITLERVELSFPLDLQMDNLKIIQAERDTVADVERLVAKVQLMPLVEGRVEVDELTFNNLKANTTNLIGDLRIKGRLKKLHLVSHGINLKGDSLRVNVADIENGWLDIALGDTVPDDTSKQRPLWKITIGKLNISKTDFALHMPGDTMNIWARIGTASAREARLLLHDNVYQLASLDWQNGALRFNQTYAPRALRGFDAGHIYFDNLNIGLNSFAYAAPRIGMRIRTLNFHEKSGLVVNNLKGAFEYDGATVALSDFALTMPNSRLSGMFKMNTNVFEQKNPGRLSVRVDGYANKVDLGPFLTALPGKIYRAIPNVPLVILGEIYGNLNQATFKQLGLKMQGYFNISATGWVGSLNKPSAMQADLRLKGTLGNLGFILPLMPRTVTKMINLPRNIGLNGTVRLREGYYSGNMLLTEGAGRVNIKGEYGVRSGKYNLAVKANELQLGRFLPNMKLAPFTGTIALNGRGTDVFSKRSEMNLSLDISRFGYGNYVLDGIDGRVKMQNGTTDARIWSTNVMLGGDFGFVGRISDKSVDGHLRGRFSRVDLRRLGAMKEPYVVSTWADVDVKSNFTNYHYIKGPVRQFKLVSENRRGIVQLAAGSFDVLAYMKGGRLTSHLKGKLVDANLHALGLIGKHFHLGAETDLVLVSDLKNNHSVAGSVDNINLHETRGNERIELFAGNIHLDAGMKGNNIQGNINGNISRADLYQLGVAAHPFTTSFSTDMNFSTDMKDNLAVRGSMRNMQADIRDRHYVPGDVRLDIVSRLDTTRAVVDGGDFHLGASLGGSYRQLAKSGKNIYNDIMTQLANKRIDQPAIRKHLPTGRFLLKSGGDNLFSRLLAEQGYAFRSADIDLSSSPFDGLNGKILVDSLVYRDSLQLDTIRMKLLSNADGLTYDIALENNSRNTYPYKGYLRGSFYEHGIQSNVSIIDAKNRPGVALSFRAGMADRGIRMNITSDKSILGYKEFAVNDSNYIYVGRDHRISADMRLLAADGAGVQISTEDSDSTSLQNLTFSMHRFELGKLFTVLPFAPKMSGVVDGDYHIVQTASELTMSSDVTIKNLVYENNPMGDVGVQLVYMPQGDGSHYVDAIISQNGNEVGTFNGTYSNEGRGSLDATFKMNHFPLSYVNGFVPDQIIGLRGKGEGSLSVKGPLNRLDINGEVYLDSSYLVSVPYGIEMRFADDPVLIRNSRIEFENFELFANNNQPLNMSGYLDFSNLENMLMDVRMRATNFEIIDAKENARSEIFGKVFVNFGGRLRGPVANLHMDGMLSVLGSTNMTYVLRDGTLATDTELNDLVQFTNLTDSTADVVCRPDINGFSMNLGVNIDEQAHIVCALNADKSNYIDLFGGGNLQLNYDPANGARLRGRYTLSDGVMKYSLPIIPLRTFTIQDGSYIEFTGDPMQPTLNITATEEVKTSISNASGEGRLVDFACGVRLTGQFPKPGVEFIIGAPEDQEIQNTLNTKSVEERSKLAVTMLASGMYLDGNNNASTNNAMNGALASFLQSQVNKITGKALSSMGLDITANMESTADVNGALHTDYTFKFSKRLWDNRLRINLGGRVSTGSQFSQDNGAYFDNFSLEYRLNKKETQYLKLYYEREAYDWLEGNQSEFGAGFMWRRKLRHFKDIFRFKNNDSNPIVQPQTKSERHDTLIRFTDERNK